MKKIYVQRYKLKLKLIKKIKMKLVMIHVQFFRKLHFSLFFILS